MGISFLVSNVFDPSLPPFPAFSQVPSCSNSPCVLACGSDRGRYHWTENYYITFASQPAWYRMENGLQSKNGKNWPKNRKWPSARYGEKMVQKWREKFLFFGRFFSHFWISARFPFYTRRPDSQHYITLFFIIFGEFLGRCIIWGISGIHANSDDFPWKNPQKSIIISTKTAETPEL